MKVLKLPVSFLVFVLLPILVAGLYYAFFASGQYVVETKYIIEGHKTSQSDMLGALAGINGTASSPSAKDSYIAQEYIWSAELLNKIDRELGIRKHYSDRRYDGWARLPEDASLADFLEYWKAMIDIRYDGTSGITTLSVTAFSAEDALRIARRLLEEAEQHVNKLTERVRHDKLSFAKNELQEAEQRLINARAAMIRFRSQQKDIDPEKTTVSKLEIVAELESQLATAEAELANMATYMKADSIKLGALRNKVSSLKRQIHIERKRWSNNVDETRALNNRIAEYEILLAKKTIAEKFYESALASLESARLSTMQQQQYLEVIAAPYKPVEAEKPYVLSNMLSVILGSFLFWVIGSLIISAVRDHV